ncbi:ribose transport system substrate-binding protein [Paraburkholderia sp. WC7.3g]|uniref:ABC transporter substrate-binding protein n=1 Tax=Paraburkholderia podalyriae TaxID=1938811 RepID=A0ABR7PW80_9BURK|nr:ABC transporter substrate-binding protein [Paraburkholderia podalyriae]MBC8750545.1 ABC transporter substrate-binding protein [Paraburkholderia podalyriae]
MQLRTLAASLGALALVSTLAPNAVASPDKPVIALANAYYGNTWRHQMVDSFDAAAKQAKQEGKIADYIVVNGDGSVAQQNSQIAELILKKVDAIAVDAASETAVNGMIQKACQAGIKVVSFDSVASSPCNYQLNFDFTGYKKQEAEWVMKKIGGKGNVIQVRGVKGSAPDNDMYNAQVEVLKHYPGVKVVATVYGQATASVAQSAIANVLPSLPHVDAVLGQGGSDDFGIAQAFEQYGGQYRDKMPVIEGGGSTDFIKWWDAQNRKNGYTTISMNTTPGIGAAAFYLSLSLVKGAQPPKKMIMPVATVTQDNLKDFVNSPSGMIISPTYTQIWVDKNLLASK